MTAAPINFPNIRGFLIQRAVFCGLSVLVVLGLAYVTLVRPFSSGFDLNSLARGEGIKPGDFLSETGDALRNRLSGVSVQVFSGEFAGANGTLTSIEQLVGEERPFLYGLIGDGIGEDQLNVGRLVPGIEDQTLSATDGVSGSLGAQSIEAESLTFDQARSLVQTNGQTLIEREGVRIETSDGAVVTRDGDIRIGREDD